MVARRCDQSARECSELSSKLRATHSSDEDSDASGYEKTGTWLDHGAFDDDDDEATNGDESMATNSSAKIIHESAEIVRVAAFPSPPVVEREDPTEVGWEAALPPRDRWPADLDDLYAGNPAGARTWSAVKAAMHRLALYHAVRDMSLILACPICHGALRTPRRRTRARARSARSHAPRCSPTLPLLFASAYQTMGPRPTGLNMGSDLSVLTREGTSHRSYGTTALKRPGEPVLTREQGTPTAPSGPRT